MDNLLESEPKSPAINKYKCVKGVNISGTTFKKGDIAEIKKAEQIRKNGVWKDLNGKRRDKYFKFLKSVQ